MTIAQLIRTAQRLATNNSPLILTAIGTAGVIGTAVLAARGAYRASDVIRHEEELIGAEAVKEPLSNVEKFQLTWKFYIPAVGSGVMTIVCIIAANRIGTRRAAAMAAAFTISEKAFDEYREKVVETIGKNKEQDIRDEVMKDRVAANPPSQTVIVGTGNSLCYDAYGDRYFESSMQKLKEAQNNINYKLIAHDYATLNEFYDEVGLRHTKFGDNIGWSVMEKLELEFTSVIVEDGSGRTALVFNFHVEPVPDFHRTH